MTDPKISVIVPVYNVEKFLRPCIESILAQTFTDFELLLVNDGSPDGSGAICDEYARMDKRVRVFHKENGGVSSARNLGIEESRGEWISFVDGDDWIDVNTFGILINRIKDIPTDIVVFGIKKTNRTQKEILKSEKEIYFDSTSLGLAFDDLYSLGLLHYLCNKLYRKEVLAGKKMNSVPFSEDLLLNLNLLNEFPRILLVQDILYHYMLRDTSASGRFYSNLSQINLLIFESALQLFRSIKKAGTFSSVLQQKLLFGLWYSSVENLVKQSLGYAEFCNRYKDWNNVLENNDIGINSKLSNRSRKWGFWVYRNLPFCWFYYFVRLLEWLKREFITSYRMV